MQPNVPPITPDRFRATWLSAAAHRDDDRRPSPARRVGHGLPRDRTLERQHLAVRPTDMHADVRCAGDRSGIDPDTGPTRRATLDDPAVVPTLADGMLSPRSRHADRSSGDLVPAERGTGRRPRPAGRDRRSGCG